MNEKLSGYYFYMNQNIQGDFQICISVPLIQNDHTSDFDTLLQNNNDTCNHHRNIQTPMIEIYKMKNNLNPPIMGNMFERRNNTYNLRNFQEFATKRKRTVKMGLETLNYRSPQLQSILPENVRQINSGKLTRQFSLKKALGNGFVLNVHADYVSFTSQTLGFCNISISNVHL